MDYAAVTGDDASAYSQARVWLKSPMVPWWGARLGLQNLWQQANAIRWACRKRGWNDMRSTCTWIRASMLFRCSDIDRTPAAAAK